MSLHSRSIKVSIWGAWNTQATTMEIWNEFSKKSKNFPIRTYIIFSQFFYIESMKKGTLKVKMVKDNLKNIFFNKKLHNLPKLQNVHIDICSGIVSVPFNEPFPCIIGPLFMLAPGMAANF
jgi:hypothetical protein